MQQPLSSALVRGQRALAGLHLGDSFGQQFFAPARQIDAWLAARALPPAPWPYTDDTAQAAVLLAHLRQHGGAVQPDALALALAAAEAADPERGYGATTRAILRRIRAGAGWAVAAGEAFDGMGSRGNGAAMRAAPLGAWLADAADAQIIAQAQASAQVTHAHVDGIAGAVAVALAAACVAAGVSTAETWGRVLAGTPDSLTRNMLARAAGLPAGSSVRLAAAALGVGQTLCAHDTVPLALWAALRWRGDVEEALWQTVSALGDRDTTCAIVGGVVASDGAVGLPGAWVACLEALP